MQHPKPLRSGTSKGFHSSLTVHNPYNPSVRAQTYHDVQLFGGMVAVGEYYVKVKIGGQELRVQIDTGSATLAAPLKECSNCKRGDKRYSIADSNSGIAEYISCDHDQCEANTCGYGCDKCSAGTNACCAKANSSNCAFHLNFGDGSGAKGMLVRDMFEWGDLKFPVTFGGIASDSPDFERKQVDGILGMAYKTLACNPSCILPTIDSMFKEYNENPEHSGKGLRDIFSICITYDSGRLVLGEFDPSLSSQKEIAWVPLHLSSPPTFYSFPVKGDLLVGGKPLALPDYSTAIVDSGTTLIVFSSATFNTFKAHLLSNYCEVPGLCPGKDGSDDDTWFQAAHCTQLRDKDRLKLPTVTFQLEGFNLEMTPSDYLINYASKGPEFWCVGIMSLDSMSGGVDVILGNTVMKKYVTVYDRENSKVGFSLSDTNCGLDKHSTQDSGEDTSLTGGTDPDSQGSANGEGDSNSENDILCAKASNCSECIKVSESTCKWDMENKRCIGGSALPWMCKLEEIESNVEFWIGGAVIAVVVLIVIVACIVAAIRKRRDSTTLRDDESETELDRPLAPNGRTQEQQQQASSSDPADTRSAFAIEDDYEDSRI